MSETGILLYLGKAWAWAWAGFLSVLPAVIGSTLSPTSNKEAVEALTPLKKFGIVASGASVGFILGSGLSEWWHLDLAGWASYSIKFLIGYFGMGILAEATVQLPLILRAFRQKYLGGE